MLERYIYKNQKKLRCGYTTGSCAAGAAKAAAMMLLQQKEVKEVTIDVPSGMAISLQIEDIVIQSASVRCAVKKDSGDDPDVTNGILIYATVSCCPEKRISITGGDGVGRVTRPGLNQPVGMAAINSVPRKMIQMEVEKVCEKEKYEAGINIVIDVPAGEEVAKKTFNPRLGIVGGISILGTSGIVEPMSEKALLDTIQVEINMKKVKGLRNLLVTPGNYGIDYVRGNTELSYHNAIKCSNYIGETLDMAVDAGFEKFLLIGHIGKLVKLGAGIMNTHSHQADGRMEVLAACAVEAGANLDLIKKILKCNTTNDAVDAIQEHNMQVEIMDCLMKRIAWHIEQRVAGKMEIGVLVFSNKHGLLGKTEKADSMMQEDIFY